MTLNNIKPFVFLKTKHDHLETGLIQKALYNNLTLDTKRSKLISKLIYI